MVSITGTMLAWGIPQIQESEAYAIYTSAQNNFLNFDADMDQVILQGEGSSRASTVSFSSGTFVERDNLDEIKYYYTSVNWSDPKIVGVGADSESFALLDLEKVVSSFNVTLEYPNGTQWKGSSSSSIVTNFPPLVYGVKATYSSTENNTIIGGFMIYGTDSLSYRYSSVSGTYKMRMFNGGIVSKEPGGGFYVSSSPLIRSISGVGKYESFALYQTDFNLSSTSFTSLMSGNYNFEVRNQGGNDSSLSIYKLRMGFKGDSAFAMKNYYISDWDFSRATIFFNTLESPTASGMGTEEDIMYSQNEPFDFRILERLIYVTFNLR